MNASRQEYWKQYHQENRERKLANARLWKLKNHDRYVAVKERWKQTNPDYPRQWASSPDKRPRINERQRSWKKSNREKMRYYDNRRRVREMACEGSHTFQEWEDLKKQYDYRCAACKRHESEITLTRDHKFPLTLGGTDNIDNIQPLCRRCNLKKGKKLISFI